MSSKGRLTAKEKARVKLLEYLGNPENDFRGRAFLSTNILGYKCEQQIHNLFDGDELHEIEREALEIRRKKYAFRLSRVDIALLNQAMAGDVPAIKLSYQRFEDWVEKKAVEAKITPGEGLYELIDKMWGNTETTRPENV